MSFTSYDLDPSLLRGVADLGFTEPTPIQRDGIPPALEGRDVLACAMTGSGKTAAFVLPILQRLLGKPRGTTRALVLAPDARARRADRRALRRARPAHARSRGAAVFGGVGMGPQEQRVPHAASTSSSPRPGRLLDHFQYSYAQLGRLEVLVLDEADRMLDMGFLPDVRRVLQHLPPARQTLLLLRHPAAADRRAVAPRCCTNPARINVERPSAPATGVTQAVYPVRAGPQAALLLELLQAATRSRTRSSSRAPSTAPTASPSTWSATASRCDRIHGNRSQAAAHAGPGRLQERPHPGAGRDRHRGARHRRRGAVPRRQLRRAATCRTTTSTASAAPPAPAPPARPSPSSRRRR